MTAVATTAARAGLAQCHLCRALAPADTPSCPRCGRTLHLRIPDSLQRTLALSVTAALLLIPANLLPIMSNVTFGRVEDNTIVGGVWLLWSYGSWPTALVIFVASVVVPFAKLLTLFALCLSVARRDRSSPRQRTILYRATEFVGRWSMVDIFVVSILVALVHLGDLMAVRPGAAALAFGAAVMTTMVAAQQFDPRLIWDHLEPDHERL
ncbi:MAG: paraquat-inducible protein A [Pseudomonadales bacterium]|nr:paraquat-inducible protein A [Pseudomonadales bacterium]